MSQIFQQIAEPHEVETILRKLRNKPENKVCIDCKTKNPDWCSIPYGLWICIECSGTHRNAGTHVTFVRSSNLDSKWTWEQLKYMQLGGNGKARAHFTKNGIENYKFDQKYNSQAAKAYKKQLKEAVEKELSREVQMGTILDSVTTDSSHEEPNSAPPKLMTQEERDEEWNFMDSVKKTTEKKEKFNIVMSEEKEKIVIKDVRPDVNRPQTKLQMGSSKDLPKPQVVYKQVTKEEDNSWDEWNESNEEKKEPEEEDSDWNSGWGEKKFTPMKTQQGETRPIPNKTKFVGLGSQDNSDMDRLQKEALRKKKRNDNGSFLELSNDAKIEYLKDSAKEIGHKTAEVSGVVYEKVTEVGEQVGEIVGKWWSGLMQN